MSLPFKVKCILTTQIPAIKNRLINKAKTLKIQANRCNKLHEKSIAIFPVE